MKAWGRLLRLSLLPSAAADAIAGLVIGSGGWLPEDARGLWLVPASLCVYHGALALNDWNDREHDARTRASRPIPSGAVPPRAALLVGFALVLGGIACAFRAAPACAAWMGAVALVALVYDFAGRGPFFGPLLLALCRAGNLGAGIFFVERAAGAELRIVSFLPCIAYGTYVLLVSRLGRMEDAEDAAPLGARPSRLLLAIALVLLALPFVSPHTAVAGVAGALALALAGASGLVRAARVTKAWTRPLVERAMGLCLRRLLVCTAVITLSTFAIESDGAARWPALVAAVVILCGYPIAFGLRALFPPS